MPSSDGQKNINLGGATMECYSASQILLELPVTLRKDGEARGLSHTMLQKTKKAPSWASPVSHEEVAHDGRESMVHHHLHLAELGDEQRSHQIVELKRQVNLENGLTGKVVGAQHGGVVGGTEGG